MQRHKLAIVAAGGPAPGINSVIGAATVHARGSNVEVLGIEQGFEWLMAGDTSRIVPLTIETASRIQFLGGSCIGMSRANPTKSPVHLRAVLDALGGVGVGMLVTIGGDDTAFTAYTLGREAGGALRVVHVPKTIDNDLDLPDEAWTFGHQTARAVGVEIVHNLMVDAETTGRWYFVVAMGRKAGHLALGIGKASGASLTLIPEEFRGRPVRLKTIVDILAGAILKRLSEGRGDGVAVLAEGLAEIVPSDDLAELATAERDAHGNLRLDEISFGDLCKARVRERLAEYGVKTTIVSKNIGYELRCANPIPFDLEYTRDLGYCAAKHVIDGGSNALISIQRGRFEPIPFDDIMDSRTGRMRVRMVNVDSDRYRIALAYMSRLKREDFDDPSTLRRLAAAAHTTPEQFRAQLGHVVEHDPVSSNAAPPLATR